MPTSAAARAFKRRDQLRSRLETRYPLFAQQFYDRDLEQFRGWFNGQSVPAPSHPRRKQKRRPVDKAALAAFKARQLQLRFPPHRHRFPANDNQAMRPTWLTVITTYMPWPLRI